MCVCVRGRGVGLSFREVCPLHMGGRSGWGAGSGCRQEVWKGEFPVSVLDVLDE